jgi:hypothetical protein
MSKTKKLRPADRHITRGECQALFVHMMNEVFSGHAAAPAPYQDVNTSDCEVCAASASGFYAGPDCGHKGPE